MSPSRAHRSESWLALGVLLWAGAARGQPVRVYELELPTLWPGGRGSVLLNGASLLPHGQLAASLFWAYDHGTLVYRVDDGREVAPVDGRFSAHVVVAVAALPWLQLSAQVPLVVNVRGADASALGIADASAVELGASLVGGRIAVAREDLAQAVDVTLDALVRVPGYPPGGPGHAQPFAGLLRAGVGRRFGALRLEAVLGGLIEPAPSGSGASGWLETAAAAVFMRAAVGQELTVVAHWPLDGGPASVELLTGIRFPLPGPFEAYLLAGPGFGQPPTFTFRFLSGVSFLLPVADPGGRALRSGPGLPEALAPTGPFDFSDPPAQEAAPAALAPSPARRDLDGDGAVDAKDACPYEPGPAELGGCPDRDSDGDGLLDSSDRCPNRAGTPELLGCPPPAAPTVETP